MQVYFQVGKPLSEFGNRPKERDADRGREQGNDPSINEQGLERGRLMSGATHLDTESMEPLDYPIQPFIKQSKSCCF